MIAWLTNDPIAAKQLKAIDRAFNKARAAAQDLPLQQKFEAYRAAKLIRDGAYKRFQEISND